MRGAFVVEDRASGACSQWAEIIRMLSGLGRSVDQVASSLVQVRSSASGGAPWLRYRTGIRLVAAAESAVVVMAQSSRKQVQHSTIFHRTLRDPNFLKLP